MEPEKRGIQPSVWGPCTWSMLHYVALAYPNDPTHQHQTDYRNFVESLSRVLPCAKCREHMAGHIKTRSVADALCKGKGAFFEWTVALHNVVNSAAGKPPYDVDAVRLIYEAGYGCQGSLNRYFLPFVAACSVALAAGVAALLLRARGRI
jgi:hypothetical protein